MIQTALTIAGSDPSGGAGIQADLKTFHQFGVYGMAVVSLLTVQNTREVRAVSVLDPTLVQQQLRAVLDDLPPQAIKTGALGSAAVIEVVSDMLQESSAPLVVDPVMVSTHGRALLAQDAVDAVITKLMPLADIIMPNIHEAQLLTGIKMECMQDMHLAAERLSKLGARAVLVKGGHLTQGPCVDLLYAEGERILLESDRLDTPHTHGTGCTYAAAVCANLAKGLGLVESVQSAKDFILRAIESAPGLGGGHGPVNHHAEVRVFAPN